ncbi:cytochrome P450 [Armillaria borealis]|uniref:Cytochrome P450 n=1 Tax=Armillaria borealis TaxID=47425 RepID=A0AA39MU28_9AGAR|nr:cytochrome P450 [Armillaria borealis]
MKIVYGYDVDANGDKFVELADRVLESACIIGNVGTFLVDYIPSLKYLPFVLKTSEGWLPGTNFLSLVNSWKRDVEDMKDRPFEYTSDSLNTAGATFAGADMFLIAIKKTVSVILSAILAFVLYPELPYIDAILLEALRWNPVVPMGVAHRSVKADVYRGYYIPAGATIIANTCAKLMLDIGPYCTDEKDYPNPLVFNPNWFMPEDRKELQPNPIAVFGFGLTVLYVPGRYLAMNTAWIAIASMASTLSFSKAMDSEGRVVEPSATFMDGFLSFPVPFKCVIKGRDKG